MHTPSEDRAYQICTRCVMDTSDPEISFDAAGVCNHCRKFDWIAANMWFPNDVGARKLDEIVATIKATGRGKPYDCIMGLSGGVDSSYLLVKAVELGLRPLVVHVDGGWNSELATNNIEALVRKLGLDLHTYVVDWDEMRDLQIAYLRSGVANQDVPQDHAFFAQLLKVAAEHKIRHVLSGSNYATESILPSAWGYSAMDLRNLRAIHRRFGNAKLKTFPQVSFFEWYVYYPRIARIQYVRPLNYMPYDKEAAKRYLQEQYGWRDYGGKHYESRFTKFFQGYYLIKRFGYDKRRAHLASMIVSGQMTRASALEELKRPAYPAGELEEDALFLRKKLGLSAADFESLLSAPRRSATEFPSAQSLLKVLKTLRALVPKARAQRVAPALEAKS